MFRYFLLGIGLAVGVLIIVALSVPANGQGYTPTLLQSWLPWAVAIFVGFVAFILIFVLALVISRSQRATTNAFREIVQTEYADRAIERKAQYADRASERQMWKEREEEILQLAENGYRLLDYGPKYEPYVARFNQRGQQITRALPASEYGLVSEADYRVLEEY
jgi:hypothetical protein